MNNDEQSNLIFSYNVRKNCPKLFAMFLFLFLVITIIIIPIPYYEIRDGMEFGPAIIIFLVPFICIELPATLSLIGFINTKLEIYNNRVEYLNIFRKKIILRGNVSDIEILCFYGYSMRISNTKTNEIIRTHFLTKSIFLIKKCKDNNVKII